MAENAIEDSESVIGFAFDGTGYGTDGTIWGGEVLVAGYGDFTRVAHLRTVSLPGGDTTIRKPYRAALAYLRDAGIDWDRDLEPVRFATDAELKVIDRQLERGFQCFPTSSIGRLFDAVSSILGLRHTASFEAQAAADLEVLAASAVGSQVGYHFALLDDGSIDPRGMLKDIVRDLRDQKRIDLIAAEFHLAVAEMIGDVAQHVSSWCAKKAVALSGGVFQNVLLLRLAREALNRRGFTVLTHHLVPPNDGGLALGQVAVAAHRGCGE
jgi:hydrogenase maturation protein HypF